MSAQSHLHLRRITTLFSAAAFAVACGLAVAGENTTTLPNGAQLTVSIDDPVTSTEFNVPPGTPSIDVPVSGTSSIGLGEPDATFVYVMDVSGSTDTGGGTGCSPILGCEQVFFAALNNAVIADGSTDEVGLAVYADSAATADMSSDGGDQPIVAPNADGYVNTVITSTYSDAGGGNGGVGQYTNKAVGQFTNCSAGLSAAQTIVNVSTNGTNVVVFASDGLCNRGINVSTPADALAATGAIVHSVAIGSGSDCTSDPDGLGSLGDIPRNGGQCWPVTDPGNLPDIIDNLIGSTLESLAIEVDGGGQNPIDNSEIDPDLPQDAIASVDYSTTASGLDPDDHTICVTASGSDVTGGAADVPQCETIHLLQLTAYPDTETNELSKDSAHTVYGQILGGTGDDRNIDFVVGGQNADTATPPDGSALATPGGDAVPFDYTVPDNECDSLGQDTITVSATIAGVLDSIDLTKEWVDTIPPVATCEPDGNPHGNVPQAPGKGGQGQNQDGFYVLGATDNLSGDSCAALEIYVTDNGSGTVFGPFLDGTVIKYTQDPDAIPEIKKIGGGKADNVTWHIIGNGDAAVTAVDQSGNTSDTVSCLVPPPPK